MKNIKADSAAMSHYKKLNLLLLICATLFCSNAKAFTIEYTDIGSIPMSDEQLSAFEKAAAIWETKFFDNITVHINIAWEVDLPPNLIPFSQ